MKIAIIALLVACAIASPISNDVEITPAFNVRQDTRFLLFTRFNPTIPFVININDVGSIVNSQYSRDRPLRVLIHGWQRWGHEQGRIFIFCIELNSTPFIVLILSATQAQTLIFWPPRLSWEATTSTSCKFYFRVLRDLDNQSFRLLSSFQVLLIGESALITTSE